MILNIFIFLVFGLIVGSFLSVVVSRIETRESIILGRSKCPKCNKIIKAYDLVPVFSYLILRGRCRSCQEKISAFYPLIEIVTGLSFALLYWRFADAFFGADLYVFFASHLLIISALIVVFFYDWFFYIIPDRVVLPTLGMVFVLSLINIFTNSDFFVFGPTLWNWILGILIGGGLFLILVLVSHEKWMGWGDVKLGALLGAFFGFPLILVALFFSFITGSIFGLALIGLKRKKMKDAIPFGPFLVLGAFIALFAGKYILSWYLGI